MKDIENKDDIELLINTFYSKVMEDEIIGFIFTETLGKDWSQHMPKMYDFWNLVLFSQAGYAGNPVKKHVELDKRMELHKEHFDRCWLELWDKTIDKLFVGEVADTAKNKASIMANLINMKVDVSRGGIDILN